MKKLYLISCMAVFAMLLGPVTAQAQVIVSGTALNISADTSNAIGATSSGAAVGKNNSVACLLSYAFGEKNSIGRFATGSFVFGGNDTVTLAQSLCLGFHNEVTSMGGVAIGRYLNAGGSSNTFVIGEGIDAGHKLTSMEDQCLSVGFNSTRPTLTITRSPNSSNLGVLDKTGRVAIGDVTPTAKLHIRSDQGEDAGIILAPANPNSENSFVRFRDNAHHITVNGKGEMLVSASIDYPLDVTSKRFNLSGSLLELGLPLEERPFDISTEYTPCIGSNAYPTAGGYVRRSNGPSYVMEFGANGMLLRTSVYTPPTIAQSPNAIDNWRDALSVKTDGTVTLNGKVGVNTENTTGDYALAVDGGVITTKVHIQDVADWQDRVFDGDYALMPLGELEAYVAANRHLPGIPSEAEVKAGGFDMAGMASALLGKVEELTLHAIRQQREIDSLRELVTVRFGYDACGNRVSRTLEFSQSDEGRGEGGKSDLGSPRWQALLSDVIAGTEATLFPNPTAGGFFLSLGGELPGGATATLCAIDGTVLEERAVSGATEEFDLSRRPVGIYLLRLSTEHETRVWKVIKRN